MKTVANTIHKRYYFYRTRPSSDKIEFYTAWSDSWTEDFLHAHFTADLELVRQRAKGWKGILELDSPGMNWDIHVGAVDIALDTVFPIEQVK